MQTVLAPPLEVPASLLTCGDEPPPPAVLVTDTDLTDWVLSVRDAGEDCRSKLGAVKGLLQTQKDTR